MPWEVLMVFRVLIFSILLSILLKAISGKSSRPRRLVAQYTFSAVLVLGISVWNGFDAFRMLFLVIALIGSANGFAAYCTWRAMAVSQSRSAAFSQAASVLTLPMGWLFLGEAQYLETPLVLAGCSLFLLSWAGLLFPAIRERFAKKIESPTRKRTGFIWWVLGYTVIWAVTIFSMRAYSLKEGISSHTYMLYYYCGALAGTLVVYALSSKEERGPRLTRQAIAYMGLVAALTWTARVLTYMVFEKAPLTVAQPVFQIADFIGPMLVGLFFFGEVRHLRRIEWIALVLGIIAAALLIVGMQQSLNS